MTTAYKIPATVAKYTAQAIARKEWRSECLRGVLRGVGPRSERAAIEAYVNAEYDYAGAGYSGRFQG